MAFFAKESLDDLLGRVVVCETRENRWIAKARDKSGAKDAERLARLPRMGEFNGFSFKKAPGKHWLFLLLIGSDVGGEEILLLDSDLRREVKNKYQFNLPSIFPTM